MVALSRVELLSLKADFASETRHAKAVAMSAVDFLPSEPASDSVLVSAYRTSALDSVSVSDAANPSSGTDQDSLVAEAYRTSDLDLA